MLFFEDLPELAEEGERKVKGSWKQTEAKYWSIDNKTNILLHLFSCLNKMIVYINFYFYICYR